MIKIGNSWDQVLDLEYLDRVVRWSGAQRNLGTLYPEKGNELTALRLCPFDKVRVVILGQDPYPGTDKQGIPHAHGLAFSTQSSTELPASLRNIFDELSRSHGERRTLGNLSDWARQGVLLLNTAFTVFAGKPGSHQGPQWFKLVKAILKVVANDDTVFMLWGKDAQDHKCFIEGAGLILEAAHPSPLSYKKGFEGCNHFKLVDEFLHTRYGDYIDWIGGDLW